MTLSLCHPTPVRPTFGQFVAVWMYNDKLWSSTYLWMYDRRGRMRLHWYCSKKDKFKSLNIDNDQLDHFFDPNTTVYYVMENTK